MTEGLQQSEKEGLQGCSETCSEVWFGDDGTEEELEELRFPRGLEASTSEGQLRFGGLDTKLKTRG